MSMTPLHLEMLRTVQDEQRRRANRRDPEIRMTRPQRRRRRI
jgi:Tfp pilus assembly protein PilX